MLPLYAARIEDVRQGDFVKVDCAACHHVALLAPDFLLRHGLTPQTKGSISKTGSGAGDAEREDGRWFRSSGGRAGEPGIRGAVWTLRLPGTRRAIGSHTAAWGEPARWRRGAGGSGSNRGLGRNPRLRLAYRGDRLCRRTVKQSSVSSAALLESDFGVRFYGVSPPPRGNAGYQPARRPFSVLP
jgi:hypothetical protein